MRLFTAIELADEARTAIVAEQQRIAADLGDASRLLRFVRAEHLHLTLVFIGEIGDSRAPAIIEVMRHDILLPPFQLVFGGCGTFPPRGAPRVLWLGTLDGAREAIALQKEMAARLGIVGVTADPRPFWPHLTLARWREGRRSKRPSFAETPGITARVEVEAVTLYQSRLSPTGPAYTALAHAHLKCP